jgi:glutamate synthase domain-containing protein 3
MGLAEVQQSLVRNGLRARVRLQVDGGLKTGRDVVVAALLGADEFAFGTAALVAAGCVMARQCHLNTCPAGIATQREDLRRRFHAQPEDVVHFFRQVAEEVREILALLGAPRLDDVIGRAELLQARALPAGSRAATVRLDHVLAGSELEGPRHWSRTRQAWPDGSGRLDEAVLAHLHYGLRGPGSLRLDTRITNADRAVGARIAGELTRRYRGRLAMPEDTLELSYRGSAGQSFGAFCIEGMRLELTGEANDFVGKGMSGGEIVVRPGPGGRTVDVIAGNTLLYGATGGRAFIAGRVGERFAVRNSGAVAVVEGTGDHACEYMTAGAVVILGPTGRNVGAGMSGGLAYVLDEDGLLQRRHNPEMVALFSALTPEEEAWLRDAIVMHAEATGSSHARELLGSWSERFPSFRRLSPRAALDAVAIPPALRGSESRSARFPR